MMTSECHALFQFPGKSIFRFSEKWFIKIDDVMYYVYKILIMSQKTSMTFSGERERETGNQCKKSQ